MRTQIHSPSTSKNYNYTIIDLPQIHHYNVLYNDNFGSKRCGKKVPTHSKVAERSQIFFQLKYSLNVEFDCFHVWMGPGAMEGPGGVGVLYTVDSIRTK